jgi:plastocyanin
MSVSVVRGLQLFLVVGAMAACGGSSPTTSTTTTGNQVHATAALQFTPSNLTIAPGESVTFVFGSVAHTVAFDAVNGAPTSIGGENANVSIARTFPTAGVYPYHCTIHPSMTGSIQVGVTSVEPPPPPPPPPPYGEYRRQNGG